MAIVVTELPPGRRLLGLGAIAAASEAGALVGPLWGGAITELMGWRWVFWWNLPLSVPFMYGAWRWAGREREGGAIDWPGAALLALGLALLTITLADDPIARRPWPLTLLLFALVAALGVAFVVRQRLAPEPMLRLAMFRPRAAWASNAATLLLGAGLITMLISVPLFVNLVLVESPIEGGLTLLRFTIAVPAGALAGGWLAGRIGLRATATIGMWLGAAGFAGLLAWDRELSEVWAQPPADRGRLRLRPRDRPAQRRRARPGPRGRARHSGLLAHAQPRRRDARRRGAADLERPRSLLRASGRDRVRIAGVHGVGRRGAGHDLPRGLGRRRDRHGRRRRPHLADRRRPREAGERLSSWWETH